MGAGLLLWLTQRIPCLGCKHWLLEENYSNYPIYSHNILHPAPSEHHACGSLFTSCLGSHEDGQ